MSADQRHPYGGRYAEWTHGTYDVLRTGGTQEDGRRVITAPLPKTEVVRSPAPPSAPDETPAPPSSRGGAERKKAVPIREHAEMDRLLSALEYERPYVPEVKRETNGDPAAVHASEARLPPAGIDTPPLEPRTKLSDSLAREIMAPGPAPASADGSTSAGEPSSREVPTVTRSFIASRRKRDGVAALVAFVLFGGAAVFALVSLRSPPSSPIEASKPANAAPSTAAVEPVASSQSVAPAPTPSAMAEAAPAALPSSPPPSVPASAPLGSVLPPAADVTRAKASAPPASRRPAIAPAAAASAAPLPFHPHTELEEQN
jgi:hypothetical protein